MGKSFQYFSLILEFQTDFKFPLTKVQDLGIFHFSLWMFSEI